VKKINVVFFGQLTAEFYFSLITEWIS